MAGPTVVNTRSPQARRGRTQLRSCTQRRTTAGSGPPAQRRCVSVGARKARCSRLRCDLTRKRRPSAFSAHARAIAPACADVYRISRTTASSLIGPPQTQVRGVGGRRRAGRPRRRGEVGGESRRDALRWTAAEFEACARGADGNKSGVRGPAWLCGRLPVPMRVLTSERSLFLPSRLQSFTSRSCACNGTARHL
jgi:hypothetical protein